MSDQLGLFLFFIEFIADKIQLVDSVWDTFIRIPGGSVLAATAFGDFDRKVQVIALLLGGELALSSHGTKAAARALIHTSPNRIFGSYGLVSQANPVATAPGSDIVAAKLKAHNGRGPQPLRAGSFSDEEEISQVRKVDIGPLLWQLGNSLRSQVRKVISQVWNQSQG